jgi:hypothetical protein
MHDARAQVLGGKLGAVAGPVAGLTPTQRVDYDAAVDSNNESEIARLLDLGAAANGKSGAIAGAVAGLTPTQRVDYDSAVDSNNESEIARLLDLGKAANWTSAAVACLEPKDKMDYENARREGRHDEVKVLLEKALSLLHKKGGEGNAGVLKPRLSESERTDPTKHCPSRTRGEFQCKWNCGARSSTLHGMNLHYSRVKKALKEGKETGPCKCTGPPAPALCAMGGAVDTPGTAAAAGSSADASVLKRKRRPSGRLADSENGDEGGDVDD